MNDKDLQAHTNHLRETYQAQLDLSRSCCDLGLKCCKGFADLSTDATNGALALAEAGRELFLDNGLSKYIAESTEIGMSLWSAWWSTGVEIQKGIINSLSKQ
ncbi:MAG: hypothetical protein AzoDbin1_03911 [Azoarcus sp.]|uniref:Uncharacterized protein n=1 Tax=Aromatoleum toluolicum TaxID=90060 RepID=A0ABX1NGV3_9RHOO|nr:hypothetical protein [Aromatoleum toluolicum]MCK9987439.1 hypothetical protein [Azoarcus sp.]NMF98479.1 hypothetical protein [Aromatoleum toluolicum]